MLIELASTLERRLIAAVVILEPSARLVKTDQH
jgi:hypothetical protein